jgi:DNA-binding transcriptional ArsR family regulator
MISEAPVDCFSAIAKPERRQLLELLARGERPVNDLVASLGRRQPHVSKHLMVLKKVGLVTVRRAGRQQMYRLNADKLKPIHDWVKTFEQFWQNQLEAIKARAEARSRQG